MSSRQHTTPLLVRGTVATPLAEVPRSDTEQEDWLQNLLFQNPSVLPVHEIEPGFGTLIAVSRELRTKRGPLDLLLVDQSGHLVLVETKLWRNPQARREVIGQIIDYATDLATWSYSDLSSAVAVAEGSKSRDALLEIVQTEASRIGETFDERRFIDAVSQNLSRGRFLLLIAGDGIHEGVEQMAEFLQRSPQLSFRLALVELPMFKLDDAVLITPRVVMRTREVTRAVIELRGGITPADVRVSVPDSQDRRDASPAARESITEEEYFALLAKHAGEEVAHHTRAMFAEAAAHGLTVDYAKKSGMPALKYVAGESGTEFSFGNLYDDGTLQQSSRFSRKCNDHPGGTSIAERYLAGVIRMLPGAKLQPLNTAPDIIGIVDAAGRPPLFAPLVANREEWWKLIDAATAEIAKIVD